MAEPSVAYIHAVHLTSSATEAASAANKMDGVTEAPVNYSADTVDTGYLGQDNGWKRSVTTSKSFQIPLSGHLMKADPTHTLLRTAFMQGTKVYLLIIEDSTAAAGSQGWRFPVSVTSYEEGRSATDLITFSATLSGQGAPIPV